MRWCLLATLRVARLTLLVAMPVAIGAGCLLNRPGLITPVPEETYDCSAWLRNEAGELEHVVSILPPFDSEPLLTHGDCEGLASADDVDAYWSRFLRHTVETDYDYTARGAWCIASLECSSRGDPTRDPPTCPTPLVEEPLELCPPAERCLAVDPPDTDDAVAGLADFGEVDVGTEHGDIFVTLANASCGEEVRVSVDEEVVGAAADEFYVFTNNCRPDDPHEPAAGHALAPEATCAFSVRFTPDAHGPREAEIRIPRDQEELPYTVALRGTGRGGLIAEPESPCVGALAASPPDVCAGFAGAGPEVVTLTHESGPGVEVREVRVAWPFVATQPALPVSVTPRAPLEIEIFWCAVAGDVDSEGSLEIATNGANRGDGTLSIAFKRQSAGCG